MWLLLAFAASVLPAFWLWVHSRDRIESIADRDMPRWGRTKLVLSAAIGGARAVIGAGVQSSRTGRK